MSDTAEFWELVSAIASSPQSVRDEVMRLRSQAAAADQLAADRLEQMNQDRKQALAWRDEVQRLRPQVEALRADAERYRWLRDNQYSNWAICEWSTDEADGIGYYRDGRAPHVVDAAIDAEKAGK